MVSCGEWARHSRAQHRGFSDSVVLVWWLRGIVRGRFLVGCADGVAGMTYWEVIGGDRTVNIYIYIYIGCSI